MSAHSSYGFGFFKRMLRKSADSSKLMTMLVAPFFVHNYRNKKSRPLEAASIVIEEIDNEYYNSDISTFMSNYYISPFKFKDKFVFLNGSNSKTFTEEIVNYLQYPLGRISAEKAGFGETKIKILENVSDRNIIYIQNLAPPLNDSLMELLFTVAGLRRSSANKIIVVIPYFGYSRKVEKDSTSNMPLYSSLIIKLIEQMGANQIVTINLSSKHITGYSYTIPIIDLDLTCIGAGYFIEKLKNSQISSEIVIVSPHVLSVPRAMKFQQLLNKNGFDCGFGFIAESSKSSEEKIDFHVENSNNYVGDDFTGKTVVIVDDEICSGKTISTLSSLLRKIGASDVLGFVFHDLMDSTAVDEIEKSSLSELVLLNTVAQPNNHSDRIIKLSISKVVSKYLEELVKSDMKLI